MHNQFFLLQLKISNGQRTEVHNICAFVYLRQENLRVLMITLPKFNKGQWYVAMKQTVNRNIFITILTNKKRFYKQYAHEIISYNIF